MRRWLMPAACAAALIPAAGACTSGDSAGRGPAGDVRIEGAWVRPALSGGNTAAYLVIHNDGGANDRLVSVGVAVARTAEIHETVREGDIVRMVPRAQGLPLPAGQSVTLEPGGTHIMLLDLADDVVAGDGVPLTLNFEHAGALAVTAEARPGDGG